MSSMPPEVEKHKRISEHEKIQNSNHHGMSSCVLSPFKKMRSESKLRFKPQHKHGSGVCGLPCLYHTLPLEQAKSSRQSEERQASALQIHHLSLPLRRFGKSVPATKWGEEEEEGRQEKERGHSRVGGVMRHHRISHSPAGQRALVLFIRQWSTQVRDG